MPFEIMVIIIVAIVAGTLGGISKQFLAYLQNRQSSGRGESTLTTNRADRPAGPRPPGLFRRARAGSSLHPHQSMNPTN
jgi:hypothetical protein